MPEPLTVLGAVAGCAGLLGFLVSTSERLVEVVSITREAKTILLYYLNAFQATRDRLEGWRIRWCSYDATWLWTEQGARFILRQLQNVHDILIQTAKLIGCEIDPKYEWANFSERQQWTAYLNTLRREGDWELSAHSSPKVLKRAALVLGENKLLDTHTTRLRNCVDDLASRSKTLYNRSHGYRDMESEWSCSDIEQAHTQQERASNVKHVMQTFFEELRRDASTYSTLAMSAPKNPKVCVLESDVLELNLLRTESYPYANLECQSLHAKFSPDRNPEMSVHKLMKTMKNMQQATQVWLSEDLKAELIRMSSHALSSNYSDGTLLLRSEAALSLAFWGSYTWCTDWLQDLCSCGLRMVRGDHSSTATCAPSFWKRSTHAARAPCCVGEVKERRHLLMAILLAELALLRPVYYLYDSDSDKHFRVRESNGETLCLSREDLYERVYDETITKPYPDAIDFCLELDDGQARSIQQTLLQADLVRQYNVRVIQPLLRYYNSIKEDRQSLYVHYRWAERWSFLWQAAKR